MEELEKFVIDLAAKGYSVEEVHFLMDKRDMLRGATVEKIRKMIEGLQKKVKIQIGLNKKMREANVKKLVEDLNKAVEELNFVIQKSRDEKISIKAVQQLNNTSVNIAKLTGQLQEQQQKEISLFFVPIPEIKDYVKENIKGLLKDMTMDDRKKLLNVVEEEVSRDNAIQVEAEATEVSE